MRASACVCVCVPACVCRWVGGQVRVHARVRLLTRACASAYADGSVGLCKCVCGWVGGRVRVQKRVRRRVACVCGVRVRRCMRAPACVCACVCIRAYVYGWEGGESLNLAGFGDRHLLRRRRMLPQSSRTHTQSERERQRERERIERDTERVSLCVRVHTNRLIQSHSHARTQLHSDVSTCNNSDILHWQ